MAELMHEIKAVLSAGDKAAIDQFSKRSDVKTFLSDLNTVQGFQLLSEKITIFIEICKAVSLRTEEVTADLSLFVAIEDVLDKFDKSYKGLLEECDDLAANPQLWQSTFALYKEALRTLCPSLLNSFHWTLNDSEIVLWSKLTVDESIEFYKLILSALPNILLKHAKKTERNKPNQLIDALVFQAFSQIADKYNPSSLHPGFQAALVDVINALTDRVLDAFGQGIKTNTILHSMLIYSMSRICFNNVELCVQLLPTLEKIKDAGLPSGDNVNVVANQCLRMVADKQSNQIDGPALQRHIDIFLKDCKDDQTQVTPVMLLKLYTTHPDIIHTNLPRLVSKASDMCIHHAMSICQLVKAVATANPQVIDEAMLTQMYPLLASAALVYYTLEAISLVSRHNAVAVDVARIIEFGSTNPLYIHTVCEILMHIGTSPTTSQTKAADIIGWLLPQCMNPVNFSHRPTMLNCAKAIGQRHKNQLLQFKPLISTLHTDPALKDVTASILDYLEDRSLVGVSQQVESNTTHIQNVTNDLAVTTDTVEKVKGTVNQHSSNIKDLSGEVKQQKEEITLMRAELAEAIIDIEKIDRKTENSTPKWAPDVAKLMNPEAPADWQLLAKRLGFTNDDVKAWVMYDDPCMSLLVEWYATHISSEATRAVYIVLKEMNREDAAQIVADAMEKAGEMVPLDEPLDLNNPPSVFISYQWGVQDRAKSLKDYLSDAGFSCWLDIGQMGGGDKLYEKLDSGIRAAKVVICLVTEKYAKSPNCNKEANLSVTLHKPMFPLLMEKMPWPPEGSMGPIFSEYLFVRFFQRENERQAGIYWPDAKMEELLIQLRHFVEPSEKTITKKMDEWWLKKTGNRVIGAKDRTQSEAAQPDVFISYQWSKQKEVYALYKKLKSRGYICWLDIEQMGAGDSLFQKIDTGIRRCKVLVSCVTEKYALSLNCRREVSLASSLGKPIIPLLLESTTWPPTGPMSMPLAQLQYVDFTQQKSLTEGSGFHTLSVLLSQHALTQSSKANKNASVATGPTPPPSSQSKSCVIL